MVPRSPNNPLDSTLNIPLYQQLYTHLRTAILSGELKRSMKLPQPALPMNSIFPETLCKTHTCS
jgi:hypothetical protein